MHPAVFGILANIVSSAINSTLDESGQKAFGLAQNLVGKSIAKSIKSNYKQVQKLSKDPDSIPQQSQPSSMNYGL